MENDLGFKLFEKTGRRNRLTPAGKQVLELARPVLKSFDIFENNIKRINDTQQVSIDFGVIPFYQTPFTSNFLYVFRKQYPYARCGQGLGAGLLSAGGSQASRARAGVSRPRPHGAR